MSIAKKYGRLSASFFCQIHVINLYIYMQNFKEIKKYSQKITSFVKQSKTKFYFLIL